MSAAIQGESLITRIEDKYLFPEASKEFLWGFLARALGRVPASAEGCDTLIESVYFDSPSLDLYQDHFTASDRRFKLRTRRYGAGKFGASDAITLELKEKDKGITVKTRLAIGREAYDKLLLCGTLDSPGKIAVLNPKLKKVELLGRMQEINSKLHDYALEPVCRIIYRRKAFERGSLRVTSDEQLRFQQLLPVDPGTRNKITSSAFFGEAADMGLRFMEKPSIVLEVKRREETPEWLSSFLSLNGLQNVKFSKYCFAITEGLQ